MLPASRRRPKRPRCHPKLKRKKSAKLRMMRERVSRMSIEITMVSERKPTQGGWAVRWAAPWPSLASSFAVEKDAREDREVAEVDVSANECFLDARAAEQQHDDRAAAPFV
jgi:hypothetical protein